MSEYTETLKRQAAEVTAELCDKAGLRRGQLLVVGCSSSEVCGDRIGTSSSYETAEAVLAGIVSVLEPRGIRLAAQCCEHLNRALIVDLADHPYEEIVNVVPQPKAGGSFATAAYAHFREPAALEAIRADAGLDIGDTLIGMHLRPVAVPLRLENHTIGQAHITAARTRPKFIGGERAHYNDDLK